MFQQGVAVAVAVDIAEAVGGILVTSMAEAEAEDHSLTVRLRIALLKLETHRMDKSA